MGQTKRAKSGAGGKRRGRYLGLFADADRTHKLDREALWKIGATVRICGALVGAIEAGFVSVDAKGAFAVVTACTSIYAIFARSACPNFAETTCLLVTLATFVGGTVFVEATRGIAAFRDDLGRSFGRAFLGRRFRAGLTCIGGVFSDFFSGGFDARLSGGFNARLSDFFSIRGGRFLVGLAVGLFLGLFCGGFGFAAFLRGLRRATCGVNYEKKSEKNKEKRIESTRFHLKKIPLAIVYEKQMPALS